MVKIKLDGAVDKSSVDQEICKSDATVNNLRKIWMPAPSRARSYGKQPGSPGDEICARLEILKASCRSKYVIFRFVSATLMHL